MEKIEDDRNGKSVEESRGKYFFVSRVFFFFFLFFSLSLAIYAVFRGFFKRDESDPALPSTTLSRRSFFFERLCCLRVSVVNQRYDPEVQCPGGFLGNNVLMRCNVPSFVRDHVTITSWLQEPSFNIYPSTMGGERAANHPPNLSSNDARS